MRLLKTILFLLSLFVMVFNVNGQEEEEEKEAAKDNENQFKKWAIELNGGVTNPVMDIEGEFAPYGGLGLRYNFSNLFGVKADASMGVLTGNDNTGREFDNEFLTYSGKVYLNIGRMANLEQFSRTIGVQIFGGAGRIHSSLTKRFKEEDDGTIDYNPNNDEIIDEKQTPIDDAYVYGMVGAEIQLRISPTLAANFGGSYSLAANDNLDGFDAAITANKSDDRFAKAFAGLSIYLGKGREHADWIDINPIKEIKDQVESNSKAIEETNDKLKDSDNDGVIDKFDEDPETPEGVRVNSKGVPIDTDYDGVPDYLDDCPMDSGTTANNGCPEYYDTAGNLIRDPQKAREIKDQGGAVTKTKPENEDMEGSEGEETAMDEGSGKSQGEEQPSGDSDMSDQRSGTSDDTGEFGDTDNRDQPTESGEETSGQDQAGAERSERDRMDSEDEETTQPNGSESESITQKPADEGKRNFKDKTYEPSDVAEYETMNYSSKSLETSGNVNYHVIGGSFGLKKNAIDYKRYLQSEGYDANIHFVDSKGGFFRVSIATYEDKMVAREELKQIRTQIKPDAWLFIQ